MPNVQLRYEHAPKAAAAGDTVLAELLRPLTDPSAYWALAVGEALDTDLAAERG